MFGRKVGGMASISAPICRRLKGSTLQQGGAFLLSGNINPTSAICTISAPASDSVFVHIKHPKQLSRALSERSELGFDNMSDPTSLFDRMVQIAPVSTIADFNELFIILAKLKLYPIAIHLIKRLRVLDINIPINHITLNVLLNCYCRLDRVHYGSSVIGSFFKLGYMPHQAALTVLMNGLIRENKIAEALELRNRLPRKRSGSKFDVVTGSTIMNALFKAGDVAKAIRVLNKMECIDKPIVYQTIINGLCKCGRVDSAMYYFSLKMFSPNVCTFNSLIQGFANLGRWDDVERMVQEMIARSIKPDPYTFYVLMDVLGNEKRGDISTMLNCYTINPDTYTPSIVFRPQGSVLAAVYYEAGSPVKSILEIASNVKADLVAYNSLMKKYCLDGRMNEAVEVFNYLASRQIPPNIFSYNILINGYCNKMKLDEALQLYREITQEGLRPNMETYNSLLKGLLIAGRSGDAEHIFHEMINRGMNTDMFTYSTLLNSLCSGGGVCKTGEIEEDAGELWYKWLKPDFFHEEIFSQAEKLLLLREADYLTNDDLVLARFIRLMRRK